jgi:serine/threonine protein phosphatase PrpC
VNSYTSSAPVVDAQTVRVVDQGAWSSQGHRQAQEDAFVLHLVQDTELQRTLVVAGVCDGHLGRAASSFVRDKFPDAFSEELAMQPNDASNIDNALEAAWNQVCDDYKFDCRQESCTAEYDPREGVLLANTGSAEDVAGTTATFLAVEVQSSSLAVLNCGDSRAVVVRPDSTVIFQTADHSPGEELQRFILGREQGLNYTSPICVMSRWVVRVGQYTYGVSRSLEGSYATSKGIISTPDVTKVSTEKGMSVVIATDGLWEVIDSEEAGKIITHVRYNQGMSAGDAAKTLCSMALGKGSKDNVSVVVVYFEA